MSPTTPDTAALAHDLRPAVMRFPLTVEARAREGWPTDTLEQLTAQERTVPCEAAVTTDELASG
ncbi:hypothetical protein ACI79G_14125 [Geodermatophilus sp. SYSU D00779]